MAACAMANLWNQNLLQYSTWKIPTNKRNTFLIPWCLGYWTRWGVDIGRADTDDMAAALGTKSFHGTNAMKQSEKYNMHLIYLDKNSREVKKLKSWDDLKCKRISSNNKKMTEVSKKRKKLCTKNKKISLPLDLHDIHARFHSCRLWPVRYE